MADYLGLLKGETLVTISNDFDYIRATQDFKGLKLFPMVKTENMKLAIMNLVEGGDVPVMALVHALDTEAKIGDRPNYEEINYELFLIKEKLNQGERLRKKIKDAGMSADEKAVIEAVYADAENLISRVLTRLEVMACELISTGEITIKENNVNKTVTFGLPQTHKIAITGWNAPTHNILGDIVSIKNASKNKIVRALLSDKMMGFILANEGIQKVASNANEYPTQEWARSFFNNKFGIEFVVVDGEYKLNALDNTTYKFFDENTITWLTTTGTLGNTFMTNTPDQDFGMVAKTNGFVTVDQWTDNDPKTVWTMASAIGMPCPKDIKQFYISKHSPIQG